MRERPSPYLGGERREDFFLAAGAQPGLHALSLTSSPLVYLQKVLLTAHHAARPADPAIPDGLLRGHAELVDQIGADERAGAAQTGFAVHRHAAGVGLDDRDELQHLHDYPSAHSAKPTLRKASVGEVEVEEVDSLRGKAAAVVGRFVQPNHHPHAQLREQGKIVLGGEGTHVVDHFGNVVRTREREKTVDDNPIHVSVLDTLQEFVLRGVKKIPFKYVLGYRD